MRASFNPLVFTRDVMAQDPSVSRGVLGRRAKLAIAVEDGTSHLEHTKSLPQQGELLRDTPGSTSARVWAMTVGNVSSTTTRFILNAGSDTLPYRSNLSLWGRGVPHRCSLCGEDQTLLHVLNQCWVSLELRRFSHRHDAVPTVINKLIRDHLTPSQQMTADLPRSSYQYPQLIGCTDARPDIVV